MEKEQTRKKLAEALKRLMANHSLEKLTVVQIAEEAGVTRQTFYRNFLDKYDLVNWQFEQLVQKSIRQMGVSLSLREALEKKFTFILQEKDFFSQAFRLEGSNSLVEYDYQCILDYYSALLKKQLGCRELPEDVRFLLELYCAGSIRMTVEWATTGMKRPVSEIASLLIASMPEKILRLLGDIAK